MSTSGKQTAQQTLENVTMVPGVFQVTFDSPESSERFSNDENSNKRKLSAIYNNFRILSAI